MSWLEESREYTNRMYEKYGELEESRFSSSNRNLKNRLIHQGIDIPDNTVMHHVNETHLSKDPYETIMLIDAGSYEDSEFIHKYLTAVNRLGTKSPLEVLKNVKIQVGTIGQKDKRDGSQNLNPPNFHTISLQEAVEFELELRKEKELSGNIYDKPYQLDDIVESRN